MCLEREKQRDAVVVVFFLEPLLSLLLPLPHSLLPRLLPSRGEEKRQRWVGRFSLGRKLEGKRRRSRVGCREGGTTERLKARKRGRKNRTKRRKEGFLLPSLSPFFIPPSATGLTATNTDRPLYSLPPPRSQRVCALGVRRNARISHLLLLVVVLFCTSVSSSSLPLSLLGFVLSRLDLLSLSLSSSFLLSFHGGGGSRFEPEERALYFPSFVTHLLLFSFLLASERAMNAKQSLFPPSAPFSRLSLPPPLLFFASCHECSPA